MLRKLFRKLINIIQWIFDSVLTPKQRNFIKATLTDKQKKLIKQKFRIGKTQTSLRKIEELKYKLRNLGFVEKAYEELKVLAYEKEDSLTKKLAAWELAVYHANQDNSESAKKCLEFLRIGLEKEKDKDTLRKAAILKAECLEKSGENSTAKEILEKEIKASPHPDLYFAYSNLVETEVEKINYMNKAISIYGLSLLKLQSDNGKSAYDRLDTTKPQYSDNHMYSEKVTVVIPVYNAEDVIQTSISSVLSQTWTNLEIIVVDDCSSDSTVKLVEECTKKDSRVKLIQTTVNGGAYVARNHALKIATGEYVTINDADDWSHPQKIELQVRYLNQHKNIIGCTSQQARTTNELKFFRRGKPGEYLFSNMSSFMFRRIPVKEAIGYWDSVRFGADSEFIKRIKKTFGDKSIIELPTGPLSFQRQTNTSLTGNSAFGFPGYFMGARKEYQEAQSYFHSTSKNLYYDFPKESRSFAIPEPMRPNRESTSSDRRHFDVIIMSDFRLDGGSNMSNLEEIKANNSFGMRTGLIQMARYDYPPKKKINAKIRDVVDGDQVQIIVYGEKVSCDVLIVRYPPVLQELQIFIPDVDAKRINVIVNQTPFSDYGSSPELRFNLIKCEKNLRKYFGKNGIWYPIGPLVRDALHLYHKDELSYITLADDNWVNIINVEEWKRGSNQRNSNNKIRIGRHSRGHEMKWPSNSEKLLEIYPNSPNIDVYILGGAEVPLKILGKLPGNWHVVEFGKMSPREFLNDIDVFVYFTHPDWVESFGRVIIEAMAVGVPVIIPHSYKELFGEAAIYADSSEVQTKIEELMTNGELYQTQVDKAHTYIEVKFGYSRHKERVIGLEHKDTSLISLP